MEQMVATREVYVSGVLHIHHSSVLLFPFYFFSALFFLFFLTAVWQHRERASNNTAHYVSFPRAASKRQHHFASEKDNECELAPIRTRRLNILDCDVRVKSRVLAPRFVWLHFEALLFPAEHSGGQILFRAKGKGQG